MGAPSPIAAPQPGRAFHRLRGARPAGAGARGRRTRRAWFAFGGLRWLRRLLVVLLLVFLIPTFFALAGTPEQTDRAGADATGMTVEFDRAVCAELPGDEARLCEFGPLFNAAGERSQVDPRLLAAVAYAESGFAADVIDCTRESEDHARGLMQFIPDTALARGVDPCDASSAIFGAAAYLRDLYAELGRVAVAEGNTSELHRWELAVAGYNAGPGGVRDAGGIPRNGETEVYVPRVMAKWEQYKGLFRTVGGVGGCPVAAPSGSTDPMDEDRITEATRTMANAVIDCFGRGGRTFSCYDHRRGNGSKFEHPRGRACDFMIVDYGDAANGNDRARGQAMAEWVVDHAEQLNVLYVIWYRRDWTAGKDAAGISWEEWGPYGGPNPHTDHVHVSVRFMTGDPAWAACVPGIKCTE